jgi:hypothetical protein
MHAALLALPTTDCPGLSSVNPVCQVATGVGSTVATAGADAVLQALAGWVVGGAQWLLDQIGSVLAATTSVDIGSSWFGGHYQAMAVLSCILLVPMLVAAVIQAVLQQRVGPLVRAALVNLPLALLLTGVAIELVRLSLAATDAMSAAIASGSGADISQALGGLASSLVGQLAGTGQGVPTFVTLLGALLVVFGAFVLWVELLVRAAAIYVAVLFLPLGLASLVWPAVAHWCRRLVDTLAALILSKFVIVAVLSLAASALASGTQQGFASVLGGGALLLLATFTPFTLLRLLPAIEAGAVHQLEGAHTRVRQSLGSVPRSAASFAMSQLSAQPALAGVPGTGTMSEFEAPGPSSATSAPGAAGGGRSNGSSPQPETGGQNAGSTRSAPEGSSVPLWRGNEPGARETRPTPGYSDRGVRPLWGAPAAQGSAEEPERDGRGHHVLARDHMGPVIKWVPPAEGDGGRGDG